MTNHHYTAYSFFSIMPEKAAVSEIEYHGCNGNWFIGDAFGGSKQTVALDNSLEGSPNEAVTVAQQTINPTMSGTLDNFYKAAAGSSVLHGVLEAYSGAINSPNAGAPHSTMLPTVLPPVQVTLMLTMQQI